MAVMDQKAAAAQSRIIPPAIKTPFKSSNQKSFQLKYLGQGAPGFFRGRAQTGGRGGWPGGFIQTFLAERTQVQRILGKNQAHEFPGFTQFQKHPGQGQFRSGRDQIAPRGGAASGGIKGKIWPSAV